MRNTAICAVTVALLCLGGFVHADDTDGEIEGDVELKYRNVNVNGSERKYDEDFDGMATGFYLGGLNASWSNDGDGWLDYARFNARGLGGEPYETAGMRLGKKDAWELRFNSVKQDYRYDLFELVPDEDGHTWNSERRRSNVGLDIHATDNVTVVLEFRNNRRTGDSLFLKDISRDVFRLEAPLEVQSESYAAGIDARFGRVSLVFRQMLSRYTNDIHQTTEGDLGLDTAGATQLELYDWRQRDRNDSDWTTLMLRAPVGDRVEFNVSVLGTLLGDNELESSVGVNQLGVDFSGADFGGTCAISGATCGSDATCDAITPGDVCVPLDGVSSASLSGDTTIVDLGASFRIVDPLTAHVTYKTYDHDLAGTLDRDLDGDGTFEDLDGDTTPGSTTSIDHQVDTLTFLLDYTPDKRFGVRAGLRSIDRSLERSGFGGIRDTAFESDGDETLVLGVNARPTRWLRLNADYEDGELDQAFANVSHFMREQARFRATITPNQKTRVALSYRDWKNENFSSSFRPVPPSIDYDNTIDGTTWAIDWSQAVGEHYNFFVRYAEQDVEGTAGVLFDDTGFGATLPGNTVFLNDNTQLNGRFDYRRGNWRCWIMAAVVESDGFNDLIDTSVPATPTLVNRQLRVQEYDDYEAGLDYFFSSGMWLGAAYRDFDYDDVNDLLDYDGSHLTVRAGIRF